MCVDWETATFNSNVTWDWWRQESVAMCSDKLDQRLLRWRDRMRSGDGRRCSVFVSVCLSQDGRNNHMLCLPQYVYLRIDPVTHSWIVLLFIVCIERCSLCLNVLAVAWTFNWRMSIIWSTYVKVNSIWERVLIGSHRERKSGAHRLLSSIKGWPSSVWPTSQSTRTLTSAWSVLSWSWSVYLLVTNVTGKCGDQARKERSLIHFVVTLAFAKAGLIARGILTAADWWKFLPHGIWFSSQSHQR